MAHVDYQKKMFSQKNKQNLDLIEAFIMEVKA